MQVWAAFGIALHRAKHDIGACEICGRFFVFGLAIKQFCDFGRKKARKRTTGVEVWLDHTQYPEICIHAKTKLSDGLGQIVAVL